MKRPVGVGLWSVFDRRGLAIKASDEETIGGDLGKKKKNV